MKKFHFVFFFSFYLFFHFSHSVAPNRSKSIFHFSDKIMYRPVFTVKQQQQQIQIKPTQKKAEKRTKFSCWVKKKIGKKIRKRIEILEIVRWGFSNAHRRVEIFKAIKYQRYAHYILWHLNATFYIYKSIRSENEK